jgi:predicted nucleic acid-binding protein
VSLVLLLDSGPLGLLTHPQRSSEVLAISDWLARCLLSRHRVVVPAIVYYELKRELLRAGKEVGLSRLDAFIAAMPGRYLTLTDEALNLAATLWATARREGQPTADPKALDVDVILAAQALSSGWQRSEVMVATSNPAHLARFVPAKLWKDIVP